MSAALRLAVRKRADARCEYCRLPDLAPQSVSHARAIDSRRAATGELAAVEKPIWLDIVRAECMSSSFA
jgi:hypothetical protein